MQTTRSSYWVTPVVSVLIGVVYLVAFSIGGHPGGQQPGADRVGQAGEGVD